MQKLYEIIFLMLFLVYKCVICVCVLFNGVLRFITGEWFKNYFRAGVDMAMCLLCTYAKESLP